MKRITFSADGEMIDRARQIALERGTTLNDTVRAWLVEFAGRQGDVERFRALMSRPTNMHAGRCFTRDEMNER